MPYRDAFESCPRCHIPLVDARSARACERCGGLWVDEAVLTEMTVAMLPPRPLGRRVLAVLERTEPPIACPTCHQLMEPTSIHQVILDRCPEHGIWFDAEELQAALRRVADPELAPPVAGVPLRLLHPSPIDDPEEPSTPGERAPALAFVIHQADQPPRAVRLRQSIIKVGRLASLAKGHLHVDDEAVSRVHALIEAHPPGDVTIIDLGSTAGTQVNGHPVAKAKLASGARIAIGNTTIEVTIVPAE